jgi:hypothetical protein
MIVGASVERPIEGASVNDSSLGASEKLVSLPCVGRLVLLGTSVFVGIGGRVLCKTVGD